LFTEARRPNVERLLVTGVDFPLGCNLALSLSDRCEVLGLCGQRALQLEGLRTAACAYSDSKLLMQIVREWQPHWILHCGPLAVPSWDRACEEIPIEQQPRLVAALAQTATEVGARLTILSSDVVFCGPRMFHDESSPASQASPRAVATRNMERALEKTSALVLRTHAYGWSPISAHAGFAQQMFETLMRGAAPPTDGRRYATPILATDLAELVWRAYEVRLEGLHHLTGAERAHDHRFVAELAAILGVPAPHAGTESTEAYAGLAEEETSLNSRRARRLLEMATPLLHEGLARFVEQHHNGWRARCCAGETASETLEIAA
jgi:dTDP-4-dehydrorhamnose reductase